MSNTGVYHNGILQKPCEIILTGNAVYIYLSEGKKDLQIWQLKSVDAQFTGSTLKLTKHKDPQQSVACTGELARNIYAVCTNPVAEVKHKTKIAKRIYAFFGFFVLLIAAICILVYVYALPWLAERSVALIPTSVEVQLGESLSTAYTQDNQLNDSAGYYADRFAKQLETDSKYPIHIEVINSDEINAFALPGGRIFIYTGLLRKMNSPGQLGALLGHEITHVIHQHSLKRIFRGAAANMVIAAVFGNASELSPWLLSKANEFKQLDYSRELETEADANGLHIMVENKIDPKGMAALLELLKAENSQEPGLMRYLSTHPDTDSRIAAVNANAELKNSFPENEALNGIFMKLKATLK